MIKRCCFGVLALCIGVALHAQQLQPQMSSVLYGDLQRLQSLTSVLYVAAHPDDENTRLLSWLARGKHVRTAYLSLTRGDGGQNIIGGELGSALGLIRTHELLAARRLDGAEQYFTRALDFGFSKTARETFTHWDSAQLVRDIIHVMERFRPDVMICRFPASRMAGHGQHEASAILAQAAVASCPSHLRPHRLLFNAYRFGDRSTIKESQFALQVGQYDPLIGMGYGELAGRSRSLHKSQGAGTPSTPGTQPEYFETWYGEPPTTSLFNGIDTTWNRIDRPDIGRAIQVVIDNFWTTDPQNHLPALLRIRSMIATINNPFWRALKLSEVESVITSAMGLTVDASVSTPMVLPGDSVAVTLRVVARAPNVRLMKVDLPQVSTADVVVLGNDQLVTRSYQIQIPQTTPTTNPYWLQKDPEGGLFALENEDLLGEPTTPPELQCTVHLDVDGAPLLVTVPLSYKHLDPLKGDVIEELRVIPDVSIEPTTTLVVVNNGQGTIGIRLRAYRDISNATLSVRSSRGEPLTTVTFSMAANTDTLLSVPIQTQQSDDVDVLVTHAQHTFQHCVRVMQYDHLPTLQYLEPARLRVVAEPLRVTARRIAFVEGAGEATADVLRTMGVRVDVVSTDQLLNTQQLLDTYDAVLVGIRALNTRTDMTYVMPALMQYVEQGGTLVMQYNTTGNLKTTEIGPFPMKITRNRVTEENATVTLRDPDHILMTTPNRIEPDDFSGWVQERGLYFTGDHDERYQRLLSMNDAGEDAQEGSLVYASYGKGHYVYCALSLFRNVPAGVPGALKLLANMMSAGGAGK
ncbi:MAG: PIG-L family deacetylase [Candidatus Kapaibacteriota bacterium]